MTKKYMNLVFLILFTGQVIDAASDAKTDGFFKRVADTVFTKNNVKKVVTIIGTGVVGTYLAWKSLGDNKEKLGGFFSALSVAESTNEILNTKSIDDAKSIDSATKKVLVVGAGAATNVAFNYIFPQSKHVLGYEPETDEITNYTEYTEKKGNLKFEPVVFLPLHGFGDKKWKKFEGLDPRVSFMGFNFADAGFLDSEGKGLTSLAKTNLGQDCDAFSAVWHVVHCYELGYKKVVIVGHSRGGAAGIKLAHIFTFPEKYQDMWKKLGFVNEKGDLRSKEIENVWKIVSKIYLLNPLLNVKKLEMLKNIKEGAGSTACEVTKVFMSWLTNIKFNGSSHLDNLKEIFTEGKSYLPQFDLYIADNDKVVGNGSDEDIKELEKEINDQKKLSVKFLENSEGHCDIREGLFSAGTYANKCVIKKDSAN